MFFCSWDDIGQGSVQRMEYTSYSLGRVASGGPQLSPTGFRIVPELSPAVKHWVIFIYHGIEYIKSNFFRASTTERKAEPSIYVEEDLLGVLSRESTRQVNRRHTSLLRQFHLPVESESGVVTALVTNETTVATRCSGCAPARYVVVERRQPIVGFCCKNWFETKKVVIGSTPMRQSRTGSRRTSPVPLRSFRLTS
jgi:hypothetical protein